MPKGPKGYDLIGQKFGRLTVIQQAENPWKNGRAWLCQCDCGGQRVDTSSNLRAGKSKSCGCLQTENRKRQARKWTLPDGQAAVNFLLSKYKHGAEVRHLEFCLTEDQFRVLISSNCHYCGITPARPLPSLLRERKTNKGFVYNGVDRKDNAKGYTPENCVPACTFCNRFKKNLSYEEFMAYLNRVWFYHSASQLLAAGASR